MRAASAIARNIARGVPRRFPRTTTLQGTQAGGALSMRGSQVIQDALNTVCPFFS